MTITVDRYAGKRVWVVGLGRSGLSTAKALAQGHADVLCWDDNPKTREVAEAAGFTLSDPTAVDALNDAVALFLSPGIPHTYPTPHPAAAAAKQARLPILGDVELLLKTVPETRVVAITGTNGKSTTTALIGHVLKEAGRKVAVGGNLGYPVLDLPKLEEDGIYVLELSSYQLELCPEASFDIAVLLNIGNDHLDRHGGMDGYVAAKARVFETGSAVPIARSDALAAVVGIDDDRCAGIAEAVTNGPRRVVPISGETLISGGVCGHAGRLINDMEGEQVAVVTLADLETLPGDHNAQNAAAATAVCRLLGLSDEEIAAGLQNFPGLPHRQQRVAKLDGILFVNDSKATNAEAAAKALASYPAIYWIAGGLGKDGGYECLNPYLANIRHAFLIGDAAGDIAQALDGKVTTTRSETIDRAVDDAFAHALREGERDAVVLLSPACASFDQFKNFELRGWAFCRLVAALPGRERQLLADIPADREEAA